MNRFRQGTSSLLYKLIVLVSLVGMRQDAIGQGQLISTVGSNYEQFKKTNYLINDEVKLQNSGFENHPELGMLYSGAPCTDCYEILAKRTEATKTFAALGGKPLFIQSSTKPLHFKDAKGRWLTFEKDLAPDPIFTGVYSSKASNIPVKVDTREGFLSIGNPGKRIMFGRKLELLYIGADGTERNLGFANWSRYKAGAGGVYITDIWPGIDMEATVYRGAVKTNFILNRPMPAYASGKLAIRDHLQMDEGLYIFGDAGKSIDINGPLEIRHVSGSSAYQISPALVFEQRNSNESETLNYRIHEGNKLDIVITGNWFNRDPSTYPIVVDPFFQSTNAVPIIGSGYMPSCQSMTGGCTMVNSIPVPGALTITDIKCTVDIMLDTFVGGTASFDLTLGKCRSPSGNGNIWICPTPTPAPLPGQVIHCYMMNESIFNSLKPCIPAPQCLPYDLDITLRLLRCFRPTAQPCVNAYVYGLTPFTVTVEGYTLEDNTIGVSAPNATICEGDSTQLSVTRAYGVPPYQYAWTPGGMTGSPITVKPTMSTKYFVTITDSCGRVAYDTVDVFVTPSDNPGFTLDTNEICADKPLHATGLGNGQLSYYSWEATGSSSPSSSNSKTWTGSFPDEGVHDITMFYQSGNCKFPVTKQVTIYPVVNTVQYDTICDGEIYDFHGNQYTRPGTYNHQYTSVHGCDSIRVLYLTVNPIPPVPVVTGNTPVCVGDELQLHASDIFGAAYQWNGPGGFNSTARDPNIPKVSFGAAGNYEVTSTMKNCTSPPGILNVVVKPLPAVSLQADKTDICSGDSVRFETVDFPQYRYQWAPDYYMLTNGEAVAYASVRNPGYIHVTVTDTGYCVNADSIYIETHPCCELFLPSAFTPNQDGKNDLYRVVTNGYQRIGAFRIVNRYGETVFDTGDQNRGWDGTYKGKPQAAGVYHYYIKYTCADGGFYEQKGDLTLIR